MNDVNSTQFATTEGETAFPVADTENDNSASSSEGEQNGTDQTQSQDGEQGTAEQKDGGDNGFMDHPRWKERESDWTNRFNAQETRHVEEMTKLREQVEAITKGNAPQKTEALAVDGLPEKAPEWFGGDDAAWGMYKQHTQSIVNTAVQQALQQVTQKTEGEKKAIEEATNFFNGEVAAIESDKTLNPTGAKVDRNKLLKTAMDNDLVDSKGRWNYKAAFKMMKPSDVFRAKEALDEKKQIANATTSENRGESKESGYVTSEDFSKPGARPW